jgi:hypothetical protein
VLSGGASRANLDLRLYIDGIEAPLAPESWWASDSMISYISNEQISFRSLGTLFLVGHDSFYVLAVLAMPMFALNTPGTKRARALPPLFTRFFGALACSLLIWYQRSIDFLTVGDRLRNFNGLAALGTNDMTSMGYRSAARLPGVAMALCSLLSYFLFVLFLRLFTFWYVSSVMPGRFPKLFTRIREAWERAQSERSFLTRLISKPDPLWRQCDGRLEPRQFFESEAARRQRTARNHVRLLLRGRLARERAVAERREADRQRWWPRARAYVVGQVGAALTTGALGVVVASIAAPVLACAVSVTPKVVQEYFADLLTGLQEFRTLSRAISLEKERRRILDELSVFHFPQRLRLARALSIWICLMLTLVAFNVIEWVVASFDFAASVRSSLREQVQYSDQIENASLLSSGTLQALLFVGRVPQNTRRILVPILLWALRVGAAFALSVTLLNWSLIFRNFRRNILELRRGANFFSRGRGTAASRIPEYSANRYIGFQVSHMTFGFLLIVIVLLLIFAPLVPIILSGAGVIRDNKRLFNAALGAFGFLVESIAILLIPILFQYVCNKTVFFRRTWILHRASYAIYDYTLTYSNALLGILAVISRFGLVIGCLVLFFPRIDYTSMPGPTGTLFRLDQGYNACVCARARERAHAREWRSTSPRPLRALAC